MTCPVHGTSLTAYEARGRLGELHHYYLCVKSKDCGQRHRIENVHDSIENILSQISVSAQTLMLYKSMLKKLFDKNDYMRLDEIDRTEKEIEKVKERITNLQDDFMDRKITSEDFHPIKQRTEKTADRTSTQIKEPKTNHFTVQNLYKQRGSDVGEYS